jgi:hypothetical protein
MLWYKDPDTTPGRHAYVLTVVRFRSIAAAPIQVTQNPMPKAATFRPNRFTERSRAMLYTPRK